MVRTTLICDARSHFTSKVTLAYINKEDNSYYELYNYLTEAVLMDIQLKKWGDNIGFLIPHKIAESFGLDENSIIELTESTDALVITKKQKVSTLDELLLSIPQDFQYPDDVQDFVDGEPLGQEIL
jgi:antitoxin MazE